MRPLVVLCTALIVSGVYLDALPTDVQDSSTNAPATEELAQRCVTEAELQNGATTTRTGSIARQSSIQTSHTTTNSTTIENKSSNALADGNDSPDMYFVDNPHMGLPFGTIISPNNLIRGRVSPTSVNSSQLTIEDVPLRTDSPHAGLPFSNLPTNDPSNSSVPSLLAPNRSIPIFHLNTAASEHNPNQAVDNTLSIEENTNKTAVGFGSNSARTQNITETENKHHFGKDSTPFTSYTKPRGSDEQLELTPRVTEKKPLLVPRTRSWMYPMFFSNSSIRNGVMVVVGKEVNFPF